MGGRLDRLYDLAVRFVAIRPRSRQEMATYLRRKGAEKGEVSQLIDRLTESNLINDQEFAANWIAGRLAVRPRSRRRLEQELLEKGLSRYEIETALAKLDPESEYRSVLEIAHKKHRLPQYRMTDTLTAYLIRQGYPYDLVKEAVAEVIGSAD